LNQFAVIISSHSFCSIAFVQIKDIQTLPLIDSMRSFGTVAVKIIKLPSVEGAQVHNSNSDPPGALIERLTRLTLIYNLWAAGA
jgi:hypothetical protein